jgi:uncharacterized protein
MRQEIIDLGGEVRFSQKVIGFDIQNEQIAGSRLKGMKIFPQSMSY